MSKLVLLLNITPEIVKTRKIKASLYGCQDPVQNAYWKLQENNIGFKKRQVVFLLQ